MKLEFIEARDLPDAWFQCVYRLLETGRDYVIDRGSYEGQKRLEFDYCTIHIKYPGVRPHLPDIPSASQTQWLKVTLKNTSPIS
jgi:thymidylate synthase